MSIPQDCQAEGESPSPVASHDTIPSNLHLSLSLPDMTSNPLTLPSLCYPDMSFLAQLQRIKVCILRQGIVCLLRQDVQGAG